MNMASGAFQKLPSKKDDFNTLTKYLKEKYKIKL